MNIGQAAARSALTSKTIRYYEDIGLIIPRRQAGNDYRDYSDADVEQLTFLQRARAVGFGLDECRELLELYRNPERQSVHVKQMVLEKLGQLDEQLNTLHAMRETLAHMASRCAGDESPHCAIIESLAQPLANPPKTNPGMSFTLIGVDHE
jgi:MerR family copper efflux transcriptional regulator